MSDQNLGNPTATDSSATAVATSRRPWWEWAILFALGVIIGILAFRQCGNADVATAVPTPTAPVSVREPVEAAALGNPITTTTSVVVPPNAETLRGLGRGETRSIPAGVAVMGDVTVTWPGFNEVMAAFDQQTGEGTIVWIETGSASVYANWGAGLEACASRTDAERLVAQELVAGCGTKGGCTSVRLVTLSANGTRVEFFND